MIHCDSAVAPMRMPILSSRLAMAENSTCPGATMRSTACPMRIGRYSVMATVSAANSSDSISSSQYFFR